MFGYVKPVKAELLVKEYEFYKATYCGICRAMKKRVGFLSNVTLSYDSVFLALVRMLYVGDEDIGVEKRRCIAHPLSKRFMLKDNAAITYTARAFAILTYYKMADDVRDERGIKRLSVGALRPILGTARKKAKLPDLNDLVKNKLAEISGLEDSGCESVDKPATAFGELLGELFAYGLSENDRLVPYTLGYHLGRFIYAADAAEDYDGDLSANKYNPYVKLYRGAPLSEENKQSIKTALLLECKKIEGAVNLLPFGSRATVENIINNVIYLGLVKRIEFLDGECGKSLKANENRKIPILYSAYPLRQPMRR
jgi:hypothetical protein